MHDIHSRAADDLMTIFLRVISDGADLTNMSPGQFGFLLFGLLLPVSTVAFLISSSVALSRNPKSRGVAIAFLCIGALTLVAFAALATYAVICGTHWAAIPQAK